MNEPTFNCPPEDIEPMRAEMTELRRRLQEAEAMLRVERQMFHAMAETLRDIAFTAHSDGSWDFVNARIYEVTGLVIGAALGDGWTKALHPDDLGRVMHDLREAVASGTPFESSFRLQGPQGNYRRFVGLAHPLRDDSDRIARWIGTATDIDDHLTAEDALEQANQKNQAALAKLAHDLRNAVAPIANSVAILRNPNADAPQRQRSVEIIDRQVHDLRAFLNKIQAIEPETQPLPTEARNPSAAHMLKRSARRILVVASDVEFADDLSTLLRVAGHEVCAAADTQLARQLAPAFRPEMLAVNLPLLTEDGDEWPRRLRSLPALATVFIVAIAADGVEAPAGCDAVLRKPFKLQEFLQFLAERVPLA